MQTENHIDNELKEQIQKILASSDDFSSEELRQAAGMLLTLADIQDSEMRATGDLRPDNYGRYAASYIRSHFQQRIRIAELAKKIGVSRGYLTQMIHRETGMSPQEYLIAVRMEHARLYLSTSNRPVREVARLCGYDDPLAFSKVFKQKCGESPSDYRRLNNREL